jgi:6-phosphogluconolactonase
MSRASLIVAKSKEDLPSHLTALIAGLASQSIQTRGAFTVALSGGSLPSFLTSLHDAFGDEGAQWDKWHILLADERCVPETDADSNLGSIREKFLASTQIPSSQIYGIDQEMLSNGETTEAIAIDYEQKLQVVLKKSGGYLDLAVLGFGPDGHTCSLFPNHSLLQESTKLVAAITDSPKPPPNRITLTFPVLNNYTRSVIICGAGESKRPILDKVIVSMSTSEDESYRIPNGNKYNVSIQRNPAPFPCAMVEPSVSLSESSLTWIVDSQAIQKANL